ncbi:MAG: hypothetical protein ACKO0W_01290 [Planctomycetota bacterium]
MTAASSPSSNRPIEIARGLLDRYRALPRAGRWIAVSAVVFGGFTLLDSVLWPIADDYNARADRLSQVLARAADRAEELPEDVEVAAIAYGPNSPIAPERQVKERLAAAVDRILKPKRINYGLDIRQPQFLPEGLIPGATTGANEGIARTVIDLRFDATPDSVAALIAEIEGDPAIDAIGDLRLAYKSDLKRVAVQMTVEKWAATRKGQRGGA